MKKIEINKSYFNVNSLPTTYLINKLGEIIVCKKGAAGWKPAAFKNDLNKLNSKITY